VSSFPLLRPVFKALQIDLTDDLLALSQLRLQVADDLFFLLQLLLEQS
jgi:hypothetical protein